MSPGILYAIEVYVTSDSTGIDGMTILRAPVPFPEVDSTLDLILYAIEVYVTSDSTGIDGMTILRAPVPFPEVDSTLDLKALLASLGRDAAFAALPAVDDWRLMTDGEVMEYRNTLQAMEGPRA